MTEPKVRLEKLGVYGYATAYLVFLGDENIGRVIGDYINTKTTRWRALGVARPGLDSKVYYREGFYLRGKAVDALVAHWKENS